MHVPPPSDYLPLDEHAPAVFAGAQIRDYISRESLDFYFPILTTDRLPQLQLQ